MKDLFSQDNNPKCHGLGYIIKEMNIHDTYFTFLSKIGSYTAEGVRLGRQINRMIKGGNISDNIGTTISREDYNMGVISQLE